MNTLNLCLGLKNKKLLVKKLLEENNIDVLCMQETEVMKDINHNELKISEYWIRLGTKSYPCWISEKRETTKFVSTISAWKVVEIHNKNVRSPALHEKYACLTYFIQMFPILTDVGLIFVITYVIMIRLNKGSNLKNIVIYFSN